MRVCRSALAIVRAHPVYIVVYVLFLSLLGTVLTGSSTYTDDAGTVFEPARARIAVIDRDGSAVACALGEYLAELHECVAVADEPFALQDALATNQVDALVFIPDGFGDELLQRARAGEGLPELEISYGGYAQASALVEQDAVRWASLAAADAALEAQADGALVAAHATEAAAERARTEVAELGISNGPSYPLAAYLSFSGYTITCSIVVCAGLVLSRFGESSVRARMLAAPVRPARLACGELGACVVLTLGVWALTSAVGVVSSGVLAAGVGVPQIALALAAMLVFALVPLALAFLLAKVGLREEALNAAGNLGGMVMSFLGGAWVPVDMLGPAVQAAARLVPAFWTDDAVTTALAAPSLTPEVLVRVGTGVGVTALFAVALFAMAFAAASLRKRPAQ